MGASNGRTKRSVERGKGGLRGSAAQTGRQEAQALELIRRAFATEGGLLYPERPEYKDGGGLPRKAWVDKEVLERGDERGQVGAHWPYSHPTGRTDLKGERSGGAGHEWGDSRGRMIRQYDRRGEQRGQVRPGWSEGEKRLMEAQSMNQFWEPKANMPVRNAYGDWQEWRPDDYSEYAKSDQEGLYALLGRLFGR